MSEPIIQSLLDADFYKFTMGQFVFHRYPNISVVYRFKCRTKGVRLADVIDLGRLREELDHVRTLRVNKSELHYLRGTNEYSERMFKEDYLVFLGGLKLPMYQLSAENGDILLEFHGPWAEAIYWETIALAILNELYYEATTKHLSRFERECLYAEGRMRLAKKIKNLRRHPRITFIEFGTRRRFSRAWQVEVTRTLAEEMPSEQFRGTSNTKLAMDLGLLPMGTAAHELDMVMSGIFSSTDDELRGSHNRVLREWWDEYGDGLSIALTDTFGTDFFFRDMTREQAFAWKGLRQDSGDPIECGERAIQFYASHGVDASKKLFIPSDGLDIDKILAIDAALYGRIGLSYGWGTDLTNDLGLKPLSLVVKAVRANGNGLVKLSDNLAKATGDPKDVERYKRVFGYAVNAFEECKY